jgi:hypothetical protein
MNEENWQSARLIPTSGITGTDEAERRATSALLAVMGSVKEFGLAMTKPLGAPAGHGQGHQPPRTADFDHRKSPLDHPGGDFGVVGMRAEGGHRIDQLERIPGWTWDAVAERWRIGITLLDAFYEREGHRNVPARHIEQGFKLGTWVANLRAFHAKGILTVERV